MTEALAHDALHPIASYRPPYGFLADRSAHAGEVVTFALRDDDDQRTDVATTTAAPDGAVIFGSANPLLRPVST